MKGVFRVRLPVMASEIHGLGILPATDNYEPLIRPRPILGENVMEATKKFH